MASASQDLWDWAGAEREYKRALELNPTESNAHQWYGLYLSGVGRHEEALTQFKRALEADPLNLTFNTNLAVGYENMRKYELLDQFKKTIDIDPNYGSAHDNLGQTYRDMGKYDLWLEEWKKAATLADDREELVIASEAARAYAKGVRAFREGSCRLGTTARARIERRRRARHHPSRPETCKPAVDLRCVRSDIWAAGAVLYEMATAHRPFEEKLASALADDIIHKAPPKRRSVKSGLSRKLEGVILKCLEKEPGKRYASARELQSDLERLSAGVTPLAARRRLWPVITASAIVVVILAAGTFFYLRRSPALTERDNIVLAEFANATGDPVFDNTLRQGLSAQLEQSPFLNLLALANRQVQAALSVSNGKDVAAMSAIALGLAGDSAQATRLANGLAKRFPEDTFVQFNYLPTIHLPTIHAAAALRGSDAGKVIEMLAVALRTWAGRTSLPGLPAG